MFATVKIGDHVCNENEINAISEGLTLLLAVSQGQRHGWDTTYIRSLFAIAGVFFVVFLLLDLLQKHPFVDLRLYCNRRFIVASMAALLFDAVFNSANFLVALMLQQVFHYTPFHAGLMLAPGAVVFDRTAGPRPCIERI